MNDCVNELMNQQFEMEFQVQVPFLQLARALILGKLFNSLSFSVILCKICTTLPRHLLLHRVVVPKLCCILQSHVDL